MPTITLPNGDKKSFDKPVSARDVAASIGAGLAKAAIGAKIDGELRDLSTIIDKDVALAIVTAPKPGQAASPDALYLMRHSAAHVMAEAIQDVVGKDVLLAYGPPTDTGFFYDMYVPEGKKISSDHFDAINNRMAEIIKEDRAFTRYELPVIPREEGDSINGMWKLHTERNKYKMDNATRALQAMADADPKSVHEVHIRLEPFDNSQADTLSFRAIDGARLSFYATGTPGKNWEDLCRGPHVPSTARIGAARVMSLASAYWHGDENSDRLIRVYGTAFATQAELDEYLKQREE
ncbi:MAG: TGS domain-containing protein, partial [Phycisphaerales bacterium]|nr:TGS domain-containing protein [Phycisphaerales bacterium]